MDITGELRELVDQYLDRVKPSGPENVMAICPFHMKVDGTPERDPSFAMSLMTGLYFCHSCQSKGNLYTFLRDMGLPRSQIIARYEPMLEAAKRNLPPPPDPLRPNVFSKSPIQEGLLGVFDMCPTSLLQAGFTEDTLSRFEIGFDESHMRVTYPLRDLAGNLVGISGRTVQDVTPKYKIYDKEFKVWDLPERINWDKRTVLWHSHLIYPQVFFQTIPEYVAVVEGFKACMWVWQAGIRNVVCLLGNYLSYEQQWILERMGAPIYLWLDNNAPGRRGMVKTAEKLRHSMRVHVVEYPDRLIDDEDAQPDSCTPEEVNESVRNASSYFHWRAH
jgi:DNA primase